MKDKDKNIFSESLINPYQIIYWRLKIAN